MKKKLLITGGSGFLGKNLALRLKDEYEVILTSRNNKNNFVVNKLTDCKVIPMDVSNIESVRDVFIEVKPSIVIHGAATKFVDLCETYPMESIDINIVGSQNVARVSMENNVEIVIGISTDKACPPIRNIYGLSKATMERLFCLLDNKTNTKFSCVRYGNVAWSTGSVFPIWKEHQNKNGIIKSSGSEMRRFFFTVDDAVDLVKNAIDNIAITHGKILSKEMKSSKMEDILNIWVKHFGGSWEKTKGRPGERLDEYLVGSVELEYSKEIVINKVKHYLISPNEKSESPLKNIVSTENSENLTENEILIILNAKPDIL